MTTARNLPFELLQNIFGRLSEPTVYECLYVCKSWNLPAIQEYYAVSNLTGPMITSLQSTLFLGKIPQQLLSFGNLVRRFNIGSDHTKDQKLTQSDIYTLLSHLPNLRMIDISNYRKSISFINRLDQILADIDYNVIATGFLERLEEILLPVHRESTVVENGEKEERNFRVCYGFRENLTRLCLNNLSQQIMIYGQKETRLYFLSHFKNLTHLSIINIYQNYLLENLSINSIFKICPHLKSFDLESDAPIIFDDSNLASAIMEYRNTNTAIGEYTTITTSTILSQQQQQQQQQKQQLQHTSFSISHLKYLKFLSLNVLNIDIEHLLSYMPHQLESLTLCIRNNLLDVWLQECNSDTLERFAKKLHSIRNLDISFINGFAVTTEKIEEMHSLVKSSSSQSRLYNWYKLIGITTEDRNLICHLDLEIFENSAKSFLSSANIDIRNGNANLRHRLYRINDDDGNIVLPSFLGGTVTPPLTDNGYRLPELKSLDILIYEIADNNKILFYTQLLLENILQKCSHLTKFRCKIGSGSYNMNSMSSFSSSYDYTADSKISVRKRYERFIASSTANNVTHCSISDAPFTQIQCTIINNSLPNLEFLELTGCHFPEKDNYSNVTFDLTGITHLKWLLLDISNLALNQFRSAYFVIEYIDCDSGEHKTAYYNCELEKNDLKYEMILTPTTYKYINTYNTLKSLHTTVVTFNLSRINVFTIYNSNNYTEPRTVLTFYPVSLTAADSHKQSSNASSPP